MNALRHDFLNGLGARVSQNIRFGGDADDSLLLINDWDTADFLRCQQLGQLLDSGAR
jgi:hypothetical protein